MVNALQSQANHPPLRGRRIVVTRPREQAAAFIALLESYGAEVIPLPLMEISDPQSWDAPDAALAHLDSFRWIVFTSANAVERWVNRAKKLNLSAVARTNQIAAVGEATARHLQDRGIRVNLIPEPFSAQGLLEALPPDLSGENFLLPRGDRARKELPLGLRRRGAAVCEVVVYRTRPSSFDATVCLERLMQGNPPLITFASPSAVHQFMEWIGKSRVPDVRNHFKAASIGPTTSEALRRYAVEVTVEAKPSTVQGFIGAIVRCYQTS